MSKRVVVKLMATIVAFVVADAVAADTSRGRPLRIAIPSPPTNFDPVQTVDVETLHIHLNTHAYLEHSMYRQGVSGLLGSARKEEGLVNAWVWPRASDYQQPPKYFCGPDGRRTIGGEDIVASLERAARHPRSRVVWALERVRRKDDGKLAVSTDRWGRLTIEFTEDLGREYWSGLLALPQLAVLPRDTSENILPHQSLYGGDYRIKKADGQRLLLERCNAPSNAEQEIELEVVRDSQVALSGLLADRYDVIRSDYTTWLRLGKQRSLLGDSAKSVKFVEEPRNNLEFIVFNVSNPKLANAAIRRALLHALDTQQLCNDVFQGFCDASGFDPLFGRGQGFYDLDKAKTLWQEAPARPADLKLLTLADDFHQKMAAWVAAEWERKLGVKVALRSLNFASLVGELMSGKEYDAAMLWIQPLSLLPEVRYLAWVGDPPPKGRNFARYDQPAWRAAIERARREGVRSTYGQLEKALLEDPPIVPLASTKRGWFIGPRVFYSSPTDPILGGDLMMFRNLHTHSQ